MFGISSRLFRTKNEENATIIKTTNSPCIFSCYFDLSVFLFLFLSSFAFLLGYFSRFMHFSHHRSSRETIKNACRSLKSDDDVGLSFIYHPTKRQSHLAQPAFPSFYSFAHFTMPATIRNTKRSFRSNLQISLYNFLERPSGLKCFIYHFSV